MAAVFGTESGGLGSVALTLNSVPSGAMIGVLVAQPVSAVRTYTASSDIDGALTSAVAFSSSQAFAIFYHHAASAGNHTITVSANTGTTLVHGVAFYETGLAVAAPTIPAANGWDDGGNFNDHYCADTTELDTTGAALIVCTAALNSSSGVSGKSPGTSPAYTQVASSDSRVFFQYREAASAATDDRGAWTSSGTARQGRGTMAAFAYASGATDMPTDPGSYAITGSAASLLRHRVLAADAGSYAITGSAADLSRGYVVVTDAGSYLLTGANADLQAARALIADPGSYTITGSAADLVYTAEAELTTDPGVYTLTGAEASLLVHRVLLADPGSYAVTGAEAGLARGYLLTADPGSYTLTGSAATFARDYAVHTEAGAYALTGFVADLLQTGSAEMTADPGVYALTGANALMLVHRVLHAEPGSYALTGSAAGLVIPYRLDAVATRRLRRAPHLNDEDRWLLYRLLQVDLEAGTGTATGQGADPEIMLRWSDDDGETWQGPITVTAGRMGAYGHRAIWRQLGRSRDRIFEVSVSDPVRWSLMAAYLNVDRGTS